MCLERQTQRFSDLRSLKNIKSAEGLNKFGKNGRNFREVQRLKKKNNSTIVEKPFQFAQCGPGPCPSSQALSMSEIHTGSSRDITSQSNALLLETEGL